MRMLTLPDATAAQLRDCHYRVLVTGASGWLGRAALETLAHTLGPGWTERVRCFGSAARTLELRYGIRVAQRPLAEFATLAYQPSILLHFACLTREKIAGMSTGEYVTANRAISQLTGEAAGRIGVERVFLTSSGAVYAAMASPESAEPSLLYGQLKLEDEERFACFAAQTAGRRVMTARLFNLSGPYINKLGSYAMASFIEQARRGSTIEIRAGHRVIRSYTSVENLIGVAFGGLLAEGGESCVRFDTAGECEVEMQELAETVRAVANPAAVVQRASFSSSGADHYVGDGRLYRELAADHGVTGHTLQRQVVDTFNYLNDGLPC